MLTIDEIGRIMSDDAASERKRRASVGVRYYEGDHDIRGYRLFYYDKDGNLVEDKARSNIKISHPFFTELVDQCVQYMLSGTDPIVRVKDDANADLQESLDEYFGEDFEAELSDTLTDACACGFGYMYAHTAENGRIVFQHADAMGVIEVRANDVAAKDDHVIYWHTERMLKGKKLVRRIQVCDDREICYYVQAGNGQIAPDDSEPINPRPHIVYEKGGELYQGEFGFIPYFRIDANGKQFSHLKPIKAIIDDYDLMSCGLSNNIQDSVEAYFVVSGFDGNSLDELTTNLRVKRQIGVGEGGGVDIKTVDIPYEARKIKLDLDRENIYQFGMGLNLAGLKDMPNTTNMAIKSAYALLDVKCNKLQKRLRAMMKRLVKVALDQINDDAGTGYSMSDVSIEFKREVMTNAGDNAQIELANAQAVQTKVATLLNVASVYGDEAVLDSLCALLDLDKEEVRASMQENPDGGLSGAVEALTGDE